MKKVRVAVLGYGHLGKWHCQKVAANSEVAEFVAIVEKFPAGQEAARANHPGVKVVSDIKEVINEIDAAFVVTIQKRLRQRCIAFARCSWRIL